MEMIHDFLLPCLWAFLICVGSSILFEVHGIGLVFTSLGGSLGWLTYLLLCEAFGNSAIATFGAGVLVAAYSEIMARVRKCPATSYLLIAIFPLVPGLGLYHTMEYYINGDSVNFAVRGRETLGMAGGLALGVFLVLSLIRMLSGQRKKHKTIDFEEGV